MKKIKLKSLILNIFIIAFVVAAICIIPILTDGIDMYKSAVNEMSIEDKIESIRSLPNYVKINDIPQSLKNATVSVEDHRFYKHNGFDFISTGRAVIENISSGELISGGSTITQQLAKNMFFSFEKTYSRKIAELIVAFRLEKLLDKDEILELYMNIIYYGNGYYGIKDAANGYFDVEPSDLSNEQAIILAGIPQSPNFYSLANPDCNIKDRTSMVVATMVENNYIHHEDAEETILKTYQLIETFY